MKKIFTLIVCSTLYSLNAAEVDYHFIAKEISFRVNTPADKQRLFEKIQTYCAFVNRDLPAGSTSRVSDQQLVQWMVLQQERIATLESLAYAAGVLSALAVHETVDNTYIDIPDILVGVAAFLRGVQLLQREDKISRELKQYPIKDKVLKRYLEKHLIGSWFFSHAAVAGLIVGREAFVNHTPISENAYSLAIGVPTIAACKALAIKRDAGIKKSLVKSREDFSVWKAERDKKTK